MGRILDTGAVEVVRHHLVTCLRKRFYWIRAGDVKSPELADVDEFEVVEFRVWPNSLEATGGLIRSVCSKKTRLEGGPFPLNMGASAPKPSSAWARTTSLNRPHYSLSKRKKRSEPQCRW